MLLGSICVSNNNIIHKYLSYLSSCFILLFLNLRELSKLLQIESAAKVAEKGKWSSKKDEKVLNLNMLMNVVIW